MTTRTNTQKPISFTKEDRLWSSFGFGLNKLFIPPLICIIRRKITELYEEWRDNFSIHSGQDFNNNLERKREEELWWQNINANDLRSDPKSYDYNVRDKLSFAKLFLLPEVAEKIEALNESLDASLVLNLVEFVPAFLKGAIDAARKLRMLRNEWAHVKRKFSYWTEKQYNDCFRNMKKLLNGLCDPEERHLVDQLENWRINGPNVVLCNGCERLDEQLMSLRLDLYRALQSPERSPDNQGQDKVMEDIYLLLSNALDGHKIRNFISGQDQCSKSHEQQQKLVNEEKIPSDLPVKVHKWWGVSHSLGGPSGGGELAAVAFKKAEDILKEKKMEQFPGDKKEEQEQMGQREKIGLGGTVKRRTRFEEKAERCEGGRTTAEGGEAGSGDTGGGKVEGGEAGREEAGGGEAGGKTKRKKKEKEKGKERRGEAGRRTTEGGEEREEEAGAGEAQGGEVGGGGARGGEARGGEAGGGEAGGEETGGGGEERGGETGAEEERKRKRKKKKKTEKRKAERGETGKRTAEGEESRGTEAEGGEAGYGEARGGETRGEEAGGGEGGGGETRGGEAGVGEAGRKRKRKKKKKTGNGKAERGEARNTVGGGEARGGEGGGGEAGGGEARGGEAEGDEAGRGEGGGREARRGERGGEAERKRKRKKKKKRGK